MPTTKPFLEKTVALLSGVPEVSFRPMMGEYLLYYRNKVVGGLYDDRFLVKNTPSIKKVYSSYPQEIPYPGAKPMLYLSKPEGEEIEFILRTIYSDLAK